MTKSEALELIVESKATSPSTRSFVAWLYENGYMVVNPDELEKINSMTVMAHFHGMNPFENKGPSEMRRLKSDISHTLSIKDTQS